MSTATIDSSPQFDAYQMPTSEARQTNATVNAPSSQATPVVDYKSAPTVQQSSPITPTALHGADDRTEFDCQMSKMPVAENLERETRSKLLIHSYCTEKNRKNLL
jgi:hypothetical protein